MLLAKYFRKLLKDRVQKSPYYGIMVDETTDKSTSLQLLIYIKFIEYDEEKNEYYITIHYLDLTSPVTGAGEDLTVHLIL